MVRISRIAGAALLLASPPSWADEGSAPVQPAAVLPSDGRARTSISGAASPDEAVHEPEELRVLREWELSTFPLAAVPVAPPPLPADLASLLRSPSGGPDALTSRAPSARPSAAQGATTDTAWLADLAMPDVPFRWDENVLYYLNFWKNDPRGRSIMATWLRRLGRYGPMIRRILRSEGLPEDLVYVAMIESSYDPTARSPVGAMGLWQLMPRAGEIYGLEQSHWVDERRHPERSTRAAAAFFRDLYRRFGDWDLVLAAYHMGYGALLTSIRKYNCNDYWQLGRFEAGLPYETTYYVPKILAAALVGRNPERFGFGDVRPDAERAAELVDVPASLDLATLARAAGSTREELALYNPHLLRGRTPPVTGPYRVLVPTGKGATLSAALPRLRPEMRRWARYTPRFGESLAMVAHRFRTTAETLASYNGMAADDPIRYGTALVVPAIETPRADESPTEPPVVSVPQRRFTYPSRRRVFYAVRRGDAAREIASFFGVTPDELRQWNAIEPEARLQEGMVLQVFVPSRVDLARAVVMTERQVRILVQGSDEFFDYHEALRGRRRIRYTVQAGDTLPALARRFDLSVGSLARINRVEREVALEPGRTLIVYAPRAAAGAGVVLGTPSGGALPPGADPTADDAAARPSVEAAAAPGPTTEPPPTAAPPAATPSSTNAPAASAPPPVDAPPAAPASPAAPSVAAPPATPAPSAHPEG